MRFDSKPAEGYKNFSAVQRLTLHGLLLAGLLFCTFFVTADWLGWHPPGDTNRQAPLIAGAAFLVCLGLSLKMEAALKERQEHNRLLLDTADEGFTLSELAERKSTADYEAFRSRVLEMLAEGSSLPQTLAAIVTGIEQLHPGMLCSILLLDVEGRRLGNCVAPSLPDFYNAAINGVEIGVGVGSCGTAAFTGERVIVKDIATHPYWAAFKDLAARAGLGACWSQPIRSASRQILGTFAIYHHQSNEPTDADITLIEQSARLASIAIERSKAEDVLRESKLFVQSVLDSVTSQIAVIDEAGTIVATNAAWRRFALENSAEPGRLTPRTDVGTNYLAVCGAVTPDAADEALSVVKGIQAVINGPSRNFSFEYACHTPHQQRWFTMTVTPLGVGRKGAVVVHTDISERKRTEEQVRQLAYCDSLTQLANRRMLHDRLVLALADSKRSGCYGALLLLDLDNFKPLNDEHGHGAGDLLLVEVARRLVGSVREVDTVARLGGDEFVVLLGRLNADKALAREQAMAIAEKIRTELARTYVLKPAHEGGKADALLEHHCSASIGVTLFIGHEKNQKEVLKRADTAMYQAKESGRNSIRFLEANAAIAAPCASA